MRLIFVGLGVGGFVVSSLLACGGDDFESTKSGGSGGTATGGSDAGGAAGTTSGGTGGTGALGGSAGAAGSGAIGGAGGSAGGPPCTDTSCAPDEYCHDGSGQCRKCTDPDELEFFPAEPLTTINAMHPDKDLHTPRALDEEKPALIYTVGWSVYDRELWVTEDYTQNAGVVFPPPLDIQPSAESTALPILPPTDGPLKSFAVLFDHNENGTLDLDMYGTEYDPNTQEFKAPVLLPAPFNGTSADWAPAYSQVAQRLWWVSNRDAPLAAKLYTASTAPGASPVAEVVPLGTFSPNCPITDNDLGPWVAPGGYMILFHGAEKYAGCTGSKSDIYVAALKPDGTTLPAFPVSVNLQNTQDEWPSMSYDMCTLYFASQRNGATHTQLYSARRK